MSFTKKKVVVVGQPKQPQGIVLNNLPKPDIPVYAPPTYEN